MTTPEAGRVEDLIVNSVRDLFCRTQGMTIEEALRQAVRQALTTQAETIRRAEAAEGREQWLTKDRQRLKAALAEIAKGQGAFSRDPLTHASNCIDEMKAIAQNALTSQFGESPSPATGEGA